MRANDLARIVAGLILVLQAVVAYLLIQTDVPVEGLTKVILGASSVALVALSQYLNVRMPGQTGTPS